MKLFNKTTKGNNAIDSTGTGYIYADGRPLTEMDFTNPYFSYEFYNFATSWRQYADKVTKWETIDSGYYRLETNNGYILFYDSHDNSCRILTNEEGEFKTKEEWLNHLTKLKKKSMYDTGIEVNGNDRILILQTCSTKQEYKDLKRIIRRMNLMGMSQYDLAERIGSSQSSVSGYISGKKCPSAYAMRLLADALNCSLDYLIGF